MRILQLHIGLSLLGGVESMIIGLSNEISKSHYVTVCSVFKPTEDGIYYSRLDKRVRKEHLGIVKNGFSIKNLWKIFCYLKNADYDIVHFHGFFYYYALPIILFHKRMKFVYTLHSDAFMENSKWDQRIFWLKKFCFKHQWMQAVTISPQSKDSFTKLYGLDSHLILNGISSPSITQEPNEVDFSRITENTRVFIHPGRISVPKNQVVLCKVFKQLIDEGHDVVLLIAGTKQDETIFKEIEPMLSDRIIYLGERHNIPQLMAHADAFCLPSIWEGLPITLLESLSVGCIPICTPVGGIVSIIESGRNGFLSKSPSQKDYYDTIKHFLSIGEDQLREIRKQCIASFEPYTIEKTSAKYIDFFTSLT